MSAGANTSGPSVPERGDEQMTSREVVHRATTLASEGSFEQALELIERGLEQAPESQALLQLGGILKLRRRDFAGALESFEALLAAGPRGANRRKVRRIIRELRHVRSTAVEIQLDVPADVYLDDTVFGKACSGVAACRLPVLPDAYTVLIDKPGFEAVRASVQVRRNRTVVLERELDELPSAVVVAAKPADAFVVIRGESQPVSEMAAVAVEAGEGRATLEAGSYVVRAWRPGYFARDVEVQARRGEPGAVSVQLDRRVALSISPPDAEVLLDGRPVELEERAIRPRDHYRRLALDGALRLPPERTERTERTLEVRAPGYVARTVPLPPRSVDDAGGRLEIDLEAEIPPPPPVLDAPERPIVLLSSLSLATLGFGAAAAYGVHAQRLAEQARDGCDDAAEQLVCEDIDRDKAEAAENAATRSEQLFVGGTLLALGALQAWNEGEPAPPGGGMSLRRKLSITGNALVSVGAAAVGIGYGMRSQTRLEMAQPFCDENQQCQLPGYVLIRQANRDVATARLGWIVSGAAAVNAALLWWRTPSDGEASSLELVPELSRDRVGVTLSGRFR